MGPIGIADFERVSEMHPIEGFEKQRSNRRWPACNAEMGKSWKMNDARPITESGEKLDFKKFEIEGVKPQFALKTTEDINGRIAATNVEIVLKTRDRPTGGLGRCALKFRGAGKRVPSADQRAERREPVIAIAPAYGMAKLGQLFEGAESLAVAQELAARPAYWRRTTENSAITHGAQISLQKRDGRSRSIDLRANVSRILSCS